VAHASGEAADLTVQIDAVDGTVMGEHTEPNPEEWSKYGLDVSAG
jgi:hypothetical protein